MFVGLTSLTLVLSGSTSLAAPQEEPDTVEQLVEATETEPSLDVTTEPTDDVTEQPAPGDGTEPDVAPTAEVPASPEDGASDETEDGAEQPAAPAAEEPAQPDADLAPAADVISPLFVPEGDPGPGEVKLIVRAGGDRTGTGTTSTSATPLAGAEFEFYRFISEGSEDGVLVGDCVTDETGECGIFADLPGDLDGQDAFYAVQTDAPAGWTAPISWGEGNLYRFSTGLVDADDSVTERIIELPEGFNSTVTEPTWASVRDNSTAPPQCGLDLAMVVDLSNSVTESDVLLDQYKAAANGFIDALTGTPSRIALHTFATDAPADGATNGGMPLTSVATAGGASTLTAQINGYAQPPNGGTNWDRGFHQVAEADESYDVVLFLTDGQPTFHRDRQGPGNVATLAEVNEAILSANAVKATGAQIILVGIGDEAFLPGAGIRIPLVAGPIEGEDFFRTDFDELGATLEDIATAECQGTLTVVKEVQEADGDVLPGGAGWTFGTDTPDVTPVSAATDETSAVNFVVDYPASELSRSVTVVESQQDGYELTQVDGQNAVCQDTTTGDTVPATNSGELGFTVDVPAQGVISCTVLNAEIPPDYDDLTVTKTAVPSFDRDWDWDISKLAENDYLEVPAGADGTFTYDVTVTPQGPVESGFTVSGTITVTNPNDVAATGVDLTDTLPEATCSVPGGTDVTVGANDSLTLSYSCALPTADATTAGTNIATATWDPADLPGTSGTATAAADFDFAQADVTETDRYVTVTDSEYDLSTYPGGNTLDATEGEAVLTYELTWPSTPGQCAEFTNTATLNNAAGPMFAPLVVNESSTEIVTLCAGLDLTVAKNVVHSFDRTYLWEIDKEAEETTVTVDPETGTATADYTVTATPTGSSDAGWAMNGTITVTNPNEWLDITADVTDAVDVGGGALCTVTGGTGVEVPAGSTVELEYTCTFITQPAYSGTNTATVTWADTVPTPNSSAVGTAAVTSDGWAQTPINGVVDVVDDKTDPANPVNLGEAVWNTDGTPTVFTYSLELEGTPDTCVDFTNTAWIAQTQQEADEVVTVCDPEPLDHGKTGVSANQQADGTWEVRYEIEVVNPNDYPVEYSLSDRLEYGEGITPTAAEWFPADDPAAGGSWTGLPDDRTAVLATDASIGGGETHTYVVVVTAEVGEDVIGTDDGQCDDYEEYGGFLNAAILTALGETDTERDCLEPVAPTVTKTAGALVDNDDGTWTVDYTIDVENPDADQTVSYDLTDELAYAGDIEILTATVERDGTSYPDWDGVTGTAIASAVELAPATTHTYTVTVVVDLAEFSGPDDERECGEDGSAEGGGLLNRAVITSGNDEYEDDACVPVPEPGLTVDKTAVSAEQLPDGTWQVVYGVVVENDSTVDGSYDLVDTLEFGDGLTPLSASWALSGSAVEGEWTDLPGEPSATLADDVALGAGESHSYVVTVVAAVADGVAEGEVGEGRCTGDDGTEGGGFLNAATLTADGEDSTDRACVPPADTPWTLTKSSDPESGSRVRPGDTITYTVTATPTGDHDPIGILVRDDMTEVLAHARGTGAIEVSTGSLEWDGDVLVWDIPRLSEPATLTYQVVVDDDAWDVTLRNVVTSEGPPPPTCIDCSTTHITPPPPKRPGLPTTGAGVVGAALLAVLLSVGGITLATTRRRKEA